MGRTATLLAGVFAATLLAALAPARAADSESSIARGARLYDKWWNENAAGKPTGDHPAYPVKGGKYAGETSWRCKECHGWDYRGRDGAYAKGGHATGIKGIQAAVGREPAAIAASLRAAPHAYTPAQLSDADLADLSLFVARGQGQLTKYLGADNKVRGDGARGESYYTTLCAGCHGLDGKKVKDGPPLGSVADNGAEMMHKLLNGQPGEAMPALRALDHQVAADIAVHLVKLPK